MANTFTLAEARELVPLLHAHVQQTVQLRGDLVTARAAIHRGEAAEVGGIPEVKALEARLQEAIDWFDHQGIQLKGIAPVIADFRGELDGEPVLWCWLEGETSLDWYHDPEVGFAGRRPLAD